MMRYFKKLEKSMQRKFVKKFIKEMKCLKRFEAPFMTKSIEISNKRSSKLFLVLILSEKG